MQTPASSRHARTLSPSRSTSSQALTIGQQQRLNVVTRLAIEGKAKQGENGAAIKMHLKMSLPMDSVTAGSTIPLFPEENVKILTSQVHPIDNNSVPYNFSSTTSPLLHSAARALNLPARSSKSYLSLFTSPTPFTSIVNSSRSTPSTNGLHTQTLDDKYTGHILVSGYNVSYVLPKEFPPRFRDESNSSLNALKRRPSISDKSQMHFMAVIELWVPYISKPPRAPYLLSIPIPRCLSNNIKLRIFPPSTTSQSFASLSSEEDAGTWDLTSDPHVTRSSSKRLSRNNSYTHFADDESSDSSTAGFSEGCGIQGTFPSTDRIRVRWATPSKNVDVAENDGRRRVGVREVKGEMTCAILGKGKDKIGGAEGVMMSVEYKGTCKGVWFGGVATLLGMDVGFEAKGSDVAWVHGLEPKWSVGGGTGYTGFDTGVPPKATSRHLSKEAPELFVSPSSPDGRSSSIMISRRSSTSSTNSLLRAPLPATNVAEYSFEGSTPSLTETGTMSSIGSLPQGTPEGITRPSSALSMHPESDVRPPTVPLTIHINMNDLLPPSKNVFTFNIAGTILVTPRRRSYGSGSSSSSPVSDNDADPEPITLPKFTVFTADTESIFTMIRNEVEGATVEVYNIAGDLRDAQTRKTVLQKGGLARCGMDGGRIALRSILSTFARIKGEENIPNDRSSPGAPRTPKGIPRVLSSSSLKQVHKTATSHLRPKRDGLLMIPSVDVTVTPLLSGDADLPNVYAVRVCLPAPTDANSEWLEFGLAQPSPSSSTASLADEDHSKQPRVEIASASVEGVPVRYETSAAVKQERSELVGLGVPFEEMSGKEWISWVRVHVGEAGGGNVQVDYVVKDRAEDAGEVDNRKGKTKAKDGTRLDVFLPTFQLPVGRLVVNVESDRGLQISSLRSNLTHQQSSADGPRLLHYSLEELFYPRLSLVLHLLNAPQTPAADQTVFAKAIQALMWTAPTILSLVLLACILSLGTEFRQMQRSLDTCSTILGSGWETEMIPETTTVTSMIMTSGHAKWWFGEATITTDVPATMTQASSTETWSTHAPLPTLTEPVSRPQVQALLAINSLPFPWPLKLDLLADARTTLDAVLRGLGKVWWVCKKVYHYPLDPS